MARVALLCPDLLFGSKLQGALGPRATSRSRRGRRPTCWSSTSPTTPTRASSRSAGAQIPRLAFYSHVEQDVRRRAEAAGIDRVVPRSRMAREAAALVESLL